jgi:hypothetical protein
VRLSLTGSRGVAVCLLWAAAIDKQKKNQWNELELLVRSVTKLQPHFITPWLFQSWNLAYNVSVESDRERDQYFYIARGVELLYEGERQNRNHPDLRFAMGHYTMNKVAQGDKKHVLQSLFQMSCIDPVERDKRRFEKSDERGRTTLNLSEFEAFCQKHPQLVLRLRDKLRCTRPEQVVRFLDENEKVPSLYEVLPDQSRSRLKADPGARFPLLPPPRPNPYDPEALNSQTNIDETCVDFIDSFLVAQAWFAYSQEALPRPHHEMPGKSEEITDRTRQRAPKMTTLLFRMFPPRAMSYVAERLEQEGWFDNKGRRIDEPEAARPQKWFPDRESVVVGERENWGVRYWGRAHDLWHKHGEANHLVVPETRLADLQNEARKFREAYNVAPGERKQFREEDISPELRAGWRAHEWLTEYDYYRQLSNFAHFYFTSMVEARPETAQARKNFFEAERLRLQARRAEALKKYEEALPIWKRLLEENVEFQRDDLIQEESYETQVKYLQLVKDVHGREIKEKLALQSCWSDAATAPSTGWLPLLVSARVLATPRLLPDLELVGPLDGNTPRGDPYIKPSVIELARNRNPNLRPGGRR